MGNNDENVVVPPSMVSEAMGVSPQTVTRWCTEDRIKGAWKTPGGHYRIPVSSLEESVRVNVLALHHSQIANRRGRKAKASQE